MVYGFFLHVARDSIESESRVNGKSLPAAVLAASLSAQGAPGRRFGHRYAMARAGATCSQG